MAETVLQRIEAVAGRLAATAADSEAAGRLSDDSVALLREAGVMRLLQPVEFGGHAAHPREFAEAVMAVARQCGSAGWVCGVGGVHPWEMALMDRRLQREVWGADPDTWIASPYAAQGTATPVEGGYRLRGHWNFSSGTDHCDWIFLGAGLAGDGPRTTLHVVLPRGDYTILDGTWDVMGLCGTGSKDVVVEDAFVPAYRTVDAAVMAEGGRAEVMGRDETVYRLPFWAMFPLGITAAVIGIAEGTLAAHLAYQRDRTTMTGTRGTEDPYTLTAVADAAAEIAASRTQLLDGISRLYDLADAGRPITFEDRALTRRNQIRSAWRAVEAADAIFARSGGNAIRRGNPVQRFWRDAHAGLQHAIHVPGTVYHASALTSMGVEPGPRQRVMI